MSEKFLPDSENTINHICYVINHAAFFVSHRLPLAISAAKLGFRVSLLTGHAGSNEMEKAAEHELTIQRISHKRLDFRSSSVNPLSELIGVVQLICTLRRTKPTLVHCASPKGLLYGGIAARLAGVPSLVLALSGMGYAFTSNAPQSFSRRMIALVYKTLAGFAFKHKNLKVIVQNEDDRSGVIRFFGVDRDNVRLIPGSGVNLNQYPVNSFKNKSKIVLFPARVLYDKGILDFVKAAENIRKKRKDWRFVIAGAADYDNPSAVSSDQVKNWVEAGFVEWLGHVEDMPQIFLETAIVCLPSYREGMPKSLLEAAAAGCAIVTTDVVGCREAIEPGVTGDLVPAQNAGLLTDALLGLMNDQLRVAEYGRMGRCRAEQRFSLESVVDETMKVYKGLIENV